MIGPIIGTLMLVGICYWFYKSIPPMDPKLKEPIKGIIDWNELGIDPNNLSMRKEYLDKLMIKVKSDYERVYKK